MSANYYGLTAAQREHKCDHAQAQKILVRMVESGAATWWPDRVLIAVNRGEQGQLNLNAPATPSIGLREKLKETN